ncbi:PREDICTED: BUD13 homolog [Priapulus caudatus]|uniref:BUD13 homolog n=1 Tax=Priapulus caudatus TaxID=37621 RepID=A0ABM1EZ92_PRICU|nr:PREDICTED: BUD13 homolog [Priapulus caudatus]
MASVSKQEYLQRYLSSSSSTADNKQLKKKRKKKNAANTVAPSMRIIDDDIDLQSLGTAPAETGVEQVEDDEGPAVAAFIDERPEHVWKTEAYREDPHWKIIGDKTEGSAHQEFSCGVSPERRKHSSDSEGSPIRQRHDSGSDQSPHRRQRHDSGSDQSPHRRQRHDSGSDQSPPRKQRHDSGSDQSPPRRQRHDSGNDQSPPRRQRHDPGPDKPLHRTARRNPVTSDQLPPRKHRQHSDSDQSPPRRRRAHGSDSDQSPVRKRNRASDDDLSPPRRSGASNAALSSSVKNSTRLDKMTSGVKAGLQDARTLRDENTKARRREDRVFEKSNPEVLGKNAETVFRERSTGGRRNMKEERREKKRDEQKKAEMEEKYLEWGTGVKQKEQQKTQLETDLYEMSKPLARYRDDKDLDEVLKNQDRDGDPMLAFLKKKKSSSQGEAKIQRPTYRGPLPPPNRFGLMPGYRWDGVDRSRGFEKELFIRMSSKKAVESEAYKWSVEDM